MKCRKKLAIFSKEQIHKESLRLFRLLHGAGNSGSESEYNCQNGAVIIGWEKIAVAFLTLKTECENASTRMHESL